MLDRDTVDYFLELHEIRFEPKKIAKTPVERLSSSHGAQSAFINTMIDVDNDFLNWRSVSWLFLRSVGCA